MFSSEEVSYSAGIMNLLMKAFYHVFLIIYGSTLVLSAHRNLFYRNVKNCYTLLFISVHKPLVVFTLMTFL